MRPQDAPYQLPLARVGLEGSETGGEGPVVGGETAVVGPLEGALAFEAGLFVQVAVKLFVDVGEDLAAPAHDDPRGGEHLVEREAGGDPAVEDRREGGDVLGQERSRRQDVAHHADRRPRVEHAAQARSGYGRR